MTSGSVGGSFVPETFSPDKTSILDHLAPAASGLIASSVQLASFILEEI